MGVRGLWSEDLPYWRRVWRNILNLLPCSIVIVVLGVLQFVLAGFTDMSKYDDGYGKVELHHDA